VFEALACGAPLLCAPWSDAENLFRPGDDYVIAETGDEMSAKIEELLRDSKARKQIADNGMQTVRNHHTCHHRALQLLDICQELGR
jgi:spore maturation protein CgeB